MSNPNWPQFPGVPNMTVDEKGRPSVLDLVPGQHEGTPLSQALFNPIIHTLCDLSDAQGGGAYLPLSGGDITGSLTLQNVPVATRDDLTKLLPLTGGTLSGTVLVGGQFAQKGETLSQTLGTQLGDGQFYLQAIQPDNVNHLTGRLVIKDLDGNYYRVLEATTDGTLKNSAGKALATSDDVQAETTRAKGVEDTRLALAGGTMNGDIDLHGNINDDNLFSKTLTLSVDGDNARGELQLLGTKTSPTTALSTIASDGTQASLFLNADNSVTTARGTCLPEMMVTSDQAAGRVVMQIFSAMAANGTVITFPNEFLQTPYTVILDTESELSNSSTNNVLVNVAIGTLTTKSFEIRKRWVEGGGDSLDTGSAIVRITAIGVIA